MHIITKHINKYDTYHNYQMYAMRLDTTLYTYGTSHLHLRQLCHNHRRRIQSILVIVVGYKYHIVVGYKYPTYECMNI